MALVSMKCPNCGGDIQLDDQREKGFCLYCGSQIDIQKTLSPQASSITGSEQDVLNWKSAYSKYMFDFDYEKAEDIAHKIMQARPDDPDSINLMRAVKDAPKLSIYKNGTLTGFVNPLFNDGLRDKINPFLMVENLHIPCTVKTIQNGAFKGYDRLRKVSLPEGLISIGNEAFMYCRRLQEINIPHSVTDIGDFAFSGCNELNESIIPNTVGNIGVSLFHDPVADSAEELISIITLGLQSSNYLIIPETFFGFDEKSIVVRGKKRDLRITTKIANRIYRGRFSFASELGKEEIINQFPPCKRYEDPKTIFLSDVSNEVLKILNRNKYTTYGGNLWEETASFYIKTKIADIQIEIILPARYQKRFNVIESQKIQFEEYIDKLETERANQEKIIADKNSEIKKANELVLDKYLSDHATERKQLETRRKELIQQLISTNGIFASKKRKELEDSIRDIDSEISALDNGYELLKKELDL